MISSGTRSDGLDRMVARAEGRLTFGRRDAVLRYERTDGVDSQEFRNGRLVRWVSGEIAATGCPRITLATHLPGLRLPTSLQAGDATAWSFGWEDGEPDPCPPLGPPPIPEQGEGWLGASAIVGVVVHGTPFGAISTRWTIVDGLVREVAPLTTDGSDLVLEMPLDALATGEASPITGFSRPGCIAHGPPELAMMIAGLIELSNDHIAPSPGPARAAALVAELAADGGLTQLDAWARDEAPMNP